MHNKSGIGDSSAAALAETFKVLGDATRVRIIDAISRAERCVQDIAEIVGLSESAVSHQLRLLRGMRLVRPRRDGRMVFYTLDDHHIVGLFEQGLEHVEERAEQARNIASAPRPAVARATRDAHARQQRVGTAMSHDVGVSRRAAGKMSPTRHKKAPR
jgi:DNA-binding transcriptional ArsR family regulator